MVIKKWLIEVLEQISVNASVLLSVPDMVANVFSNVTVQKNMLPTRNDAEMGLTNLLHAWA